MNKEAVAKELLAVAKDLTAAFGHHYDVADAVLGWRIQLGRRMDMITKHTQKLVDIADGIDVSEDSRELVFESTVKAAREEIKFIEREIPDMKKMLDALKQALDKVTKDLDGIKVA